MTASFNRQQVIYWGEFIIVAYKMYVRGVTNPPQPKDFPEGWKIVKNINAEAVALFYRQPEFLGFVAQRVDAPHQFAVVLHGTESVTDYIDDFEFAKTTFTLVPSVGQTEYGFTRYYESFRFVDPISGGSQTLIEYLDTLTHQDAFTVAGFSLGGALATLHSLVLASRQIPVEAYLFGSPMVGDATFVKAYTSLVPSSSRIVNKPDIVPRLPGTELGYEHVNTLLEVNSLNFPMVKRSVSCFHSLNSYLYALGVTNIELGSCKA